MSSLKADEIEFLAFYRRLRSKITSAKNNVSINSEPSSNSTETVDRPILLNDQSTPDVIRLFEVSENDYTAYRVYYDDAIYIADHVYRTRSVIKYLGKQPFGNYDKGLPYVLLKSTIVQPFLKDALLHLGIKIEIYVTKSVASSTYGKSGGNDPWVLVKQASPGNLREVEDLLGNSVIDENPVVIALKVQSKKVDAVGATLGGAGGSGPSAGTSASARVVGICFVDATTREIGVFEFIDNDRFSNLETVLIQLGVKECVIPGKESQDQQPIGQTQEAHDMIKVLGLLEKCDVAVTFRRPSDFNTRDIEQDLSKLLSPTSIPITALPALSSQCAMSATSALVKYLELLSQPDIFGQFSIVQHDLDQYMRLDSSAMKALNLMPTPGQGSIGSGPSSQNSAARSSSLFGLLNWCKTSAGTRLLGQWLKQPLMDIDAIRERHTLVGAFVDNGILRQTLQEDSLRSVPDISRLVRKLLRGAATLEDAVRIYQMVIKIPELIMALEEYQDEELTAEEDSRPAKEIIDEIYTSKIKNAYTNLEKLQELIETTVDMDALDNHEYVIKPDYDERLKEIRGRLDELKELMSDEHLRAGDDLGMDPEKKLKLENHNIHGWSFRLTRTEAKCLRTSTGYTELSTQKNGVYFTSRGLTSLSSEFKDLQKEYNSTQSELVKEVITIVATYSPVLEDLSHTLAHLDVIVAFAVAAVNAPTQYVRPKMHPKGSGRTILKEARHPCLENQDGMRFIPNDVNLIRGESEFLLVTGPNMGGKSTYIRQIGVIALMAQTGSFIPCSVEGCELTIVDSILARVGAGDSQLKGVSTFMAEMLETATILKSATKDSLIVIDELGRGTSTYDGFGLAWAISEHIVKEIKCFGMFATHFHELTKLADLYPNSVKNLHVVAHVREVDTHIAMETSHKSDNKINDDDTFSSPSIALLYKVEPGVSDQSFGIHVAEVVHFPQKVVRMAKRKAIELEDFEEKNTESTKSTLPKFKKSEIQKGTEVVKSLLKEWAKKVGPLDDEAEGSASSLDSKQIMQKLEEVLKQEGFEGEISADAFANSLMSRL